LQLVQLPQLETMSDSELQMALTYISQS
jgi:hypothetical protein